MRVISQDGRLDFPYERSIVFLSLEDATIVQIQAIGDDEAGTLAKYSTEEKAKKAFNDYLFGIRESNSRQRIKESLEKLTQTNIILHESGLFDIYNLNESEANSAIEKIRNIRFVE